MLGYKSCKDMKDERLYIDDELVDLGTDTKITLIMVIY